MILLRSGAARRSSDLPRRSSVKVRAGSLLDTLQILHRTLFLWLFGAAAAMACTEPFPDSVVLIDDVASQIGCSVGYTTLARSSPQVEQAISDFKAGRFQPLAAEEFAFGFESEAFWITFALENEAFETQHVVIDFGRPYVESLHVWAGAEDRDVRSILIEGSGRPFHDRPVPGRMIVSSAVAVAPGETLRIWAYAAFDGPARLPISIYPEALVNEIALRRDFPLLIFMAASGILLVTIAAFALALRSRTGLLYAGFFAGVLAYNAQLSGLLFAHVWPHWPEWNALASHPIGLVSVIFALLFAREFTRAGHRRVLLLWTIRGLAGVSLVFIAAPLLLPLTLVKSFAGLIVLAFLAVQLWAAVSAVMDKVPGSGYYFAGTLVLLAYLGAFTVSAQIEAALGQQANEAILRHGQLVDGAIFCLAVFRQTWVLRERETAYRIQAARTEKELVTTRHDIRQPLLSMRVAMEKILEDGNVDDAETRSKFTTGLSYIEGIISARTTDGEQPGQHGNGTRSALEGIPLQLLFENLALMFVDEARQNGAVIKVVKTSAVVRADALDLFRILSNLVSNAVQHSGSDRILLGVRRTAGAVAIDVLDRGVGLDARYASAAGEPGREGLGLGIVDHLCEKNGWRLKVLGTGASGTHLRVVGLKPEET